MSTDWPKTTRSGGASDTVVFEEFSRILNAVYDLAGRGPAIDLGCGEAHVTRNWGMCVLTDLVARNGIGRSVEQIDIRWVPEWFRRDNRRVNLVVMTDSIEHLTAPDATKLLYEMANLSKAMVIFTPSGPMKLDEKATDPDTHKSAWWPADFAKDGWTVWEWPNYHHFEGGEIFGAFWAWKWREGETPSVETVAAKAGVAI